MSHHIRSRVGRTGPVRRALRVDAPRSQVGRVVPDEPCLVLPSVLRPPSSVFCPPSRRRLGGGGFTLLELLAVIAIIAVLTSVVIGVGRRASESGKIARAKAELAVLSAALESYKRQYGDYPQTGAVAVNALTATPAADDGPGILFNALAGKRGPRAALTAIDGPMFAEFAKLSLQSSTSLPTPGNTTQLANAFLDPWGHRYLYFYKTDATSWTNPSFVLYSAGPDADRAATEAECHTPPSATGVIDVAAAPNLDNVFANRP